MTGIMHICAGIGVEWCRITEYVYMCYAVTLKCLGKSVIWLYGFCGGKMLFV